MKKIFVDYRLSAYEKFNLEKLGFEVLAVPACNTLYEAICGHPDILMHIINSNTIIVHRGMPIDFINRLEKYNIEVLLSNNFLESKYPGDIILNALNLNNIFLHNLNYTDKKLLQHVENKRQLNTMQGYTKCSTAIISQNALITSDVNIARVLKKQNLDILLIPPGDIVLPGLSYGFIGGTCGLVDEKTLAFYGSLENYVYGKEVLEFLKKHKVAPIYLSEGKLTDRGSILSI